MLSWFETFRADLIGHGRDLMILGIGHLAFRPDKLTLQGEGLQGAENKKG